ncbi:MAG: hypothetical protein CFE23_02260 [Flavobacterium sp. BFFFF1]|uniref:hypothetical protein n=1 Tax=Flavobacterium sp. BFFFF1 TaxID=2015557 RepID=UPI000BD6AFAD|nr:hypothetical protein [Flavobacterium sp. BFFFF1]OYU81730.1 MAG: hypothetical protein CFE23_02260 [Flavobacterium sp. BFFFF1]
MEPEKTLKRKILSNRLTPLVLMPLNLAFFFYVIPPDVASEYSVSLALVGSVSTLILSFWIAIMVVPKALDKAPVAVGLLCISTLFVFGYFFILKGVDFSSDEFAKYGQYAEAVVVDKTQVYGRRGKTIQDMDVSFNDAYGTAWQAEITLSEREYEQFQQGQHIMIHYSAKHPKIARVAYEKMRSY